MTPAPSESSPPPADLAVLRSLLQRRLDVIGDRALRESDPAAQLGQLREVSEAIAAFHQRHRAGLPPRLNHFLEQASFQKAAEFIDGSGR